MSLIMREMQMQKKAQQDISSHVLGGLPWGKRREEVVGKDVEKLESCTLTVGL